MTQHINSDDLEMWRLAVERRKEAARVLAAVTKSHEEAVLSHRFAMEELARRYGLVNGDHFDPETGAITRQTPAPSPTEPSADVANTAEEPAPACGTPAVPELTLTSED